MHRTVVGVFQDRNKARHTVARLGELGIDGEQVNLIISQPEVRQEVGMIKQTRAAEGAAAGGILGLALGGIAALFSLAIPGGVLLVAGPLGAALAGMGFGAAGGGLAGTLIGLGTPHETARIISQHVEAGRLLVSVATTDEQLALRISDVFEECGADTQITYVAPTRGEMLGADAEAADTEEPDSEEPTAPRPYRWQREEPRPGA